MKKTLLIAAAATTALALNAQSFNATQWGRNGAEGFNANQEFSTSTEDNTVTATFKTQENSKIYRVGVSNLVPITLGGNYTLVVMKVTYGGGATFQNFSGNTVQVRRQMRKVSSASDLTADNCVSPYFITADNKALGRYALDNVATATVAYYWRYLPELGYNNVTPAINPNWENEFVLPYNSNNNKGFTFDDNTVYGYSYLGIRVINNNNVEKDNGSIPANSTVTFNYIEVVSPEKLGYTATTMPTNNVTFGKAVQKYIEAALVSTGIESVGADNELAVSVNGNCVTVAGATAVEAYNLAGVKVAQGLDEVTVPAGIYVVRATSANGTTVAKVSVK